MHVFPNPVTYEGRVEGRVEINLNGTWGTVCGDGWDLNDAKVACREQGFESAIAARGGAYYGQGSGMIWFDNLRCNGTELSLQQCPHSGWGNHNCTHEQDAGVKCTSSSNDHFIPNNKTPQFSCQIEDIQLNPEDRKKINDGEKVYRILTATAVLDCDKDSTCKVHIVISSDHNTTVTNNTTVINNCNSNMDLWYAIIVTFSAVASTICDFIIAAKISKIAILALDKISKKKDSVQNPKSDNRAIDQVRRSNDELRIRAGEAEQCSDNTVKSTHGDRFTPENASAGVIYDKFGNGDGVETINIYGSQQSIE